MTESESIAKKLYEAKRSLAAKFNEKTPKRTWYQLPDKKRELLVAATDAILGRNQSIEESVKRYLQRAENMVAESDAQSLASDRNQWQRRLGVLLTHVEGFLADIISAPEGQRTISRDDAEKELELVYRIVNASSTGNIDEPYADVARLAVRHTLQTALSAGMIEPGPHAPEWLRRDRERE